MKTLNTTLQVSKSYVSLQEAAEKLNVKPNTLSVFLSNHPSLKREYVFKTKYEGRQRYVVRVEGLIVIANVKDSDRGNQRKNQPSSQFYEGKKKIAEVALVKTQEQETIFAFLQGIGKRLDTIEQKIDRTERLEMLPLPGSVDEPAPLDFRAMLNMRVRSFAIENGQLPQVVWSRLYQEMYYRYKVNATMRAKKYDCSPLDILEGQGLLEEAFKVVCKVFPLRSDHAKAY